VGAISGNNVPPEVEEEELEEVEEEEEDDDDDDGIKDVMESEGEVMMLRREVKALPCDVEGVFVSIGNIDVKKCIPYIS
jgi:hypothetical protein